jgi:hypothetical protein
MIVQQQLGDLRQVRDSEPFLSVSRALDIGMLGNQSGQRPSFEGVAASLVESYYRLRSASQPAFKLALIKQQKFTSQGRARRIAASLAALNAAQPIELSLPEWKQILEEVEYDDEG